MKAKIRERIEFTPAPVQTYDPPGNQGWNDLDGEHVPYVEAVYVEIASRISGDTKRSEALRMLYARLACREVSCFLNFSMSRAITEHYGSCSARRERLDWERLNELWRVRMGAM